MVMFEADALDFPFVAELPKREKSRVVKLWERLDMLAKLVEEHGALIPRSFAAKLLDVSAQRIDQFVKDGRLLRLEVDGHVFIGENSIVALAAEERKAGRPFKLPGVKETLRLSLETARAMRQTK